MLASRLRLFGVVAVGLALATAIVGCQHCLLVLDRSCKLLEPRCARAIWTTVPGGSVAVVHMLLLAVLGTRLATRPTRGSGWSYVAGALALETLGHAIAYVRWYHVEISYVGGAGALWQGLGVARLVLALVVPAVVLLAKRDPELPGARVVTSAAAGSRSSRRADR